MSAKAAQDDDAITSVRMKYSGRDNPRYVDCPIPFTKLSDHEHTLVFERKNPGDQYAVCDVPLRYAAELLKIGGHFSLDDKPTPAVLRALKDQEVANELKEELKAAEDASV